MSSPAGNRHERRLQYEQLRSDLMLERSTFDAHWRELGDLLLPRRTRFQVTDRNKGDKRNQSILDSTPRYSARTLQSGLHAGLTSPARPWMRLTTPDPDLAEFGPAKQWLHTVTQRMLTVFLRSNLYNALPTLYGDMGVFGTAAMGVLEDDQDLLRCYSYPIGSYAVGLDDRGIATTFVRDYIVTVRQLVQQFRGGEGRDIDWSRFSGTVKSAWDAGRYETPIEISWLVTPNPEADPKKFDARYLPWHSCYFERGRDGIGFLKESGFRSFPVLVPRWDVTAEDTYGTDCPGMTALPDIKSLQVMQRNKAKAVAKAIDPPLVGPMSLKTQKTSLVPGDVTYSDVREGMQGLRPIHQVELTGVQFLSLDIQEIQHRVKRAFFEDLFLMLAMSDQRGAQPITAREVEERHEEKLLALGPVLERLNDELLDRLVDRAFGIMSAGGLLPDPPEELHGVDLKVEYISVMAQAQKLVGVVGQDRFLSSVAQLATTFPEARFKVNVNHGINSYAEMLGVDPKLLRSDEEADQMREAEAQAAATQQQAASLKDVAGAAAQLGKTPMDGDNALRAVIEGVQ